MLKDLLSDVRKLTNKKKGKVLQRFFKTGVGEYGYGDSFAGLTVPQSRNLAIKYKDLSFLEISILIQSEIHEERLIALLILVHNFEKYPLKQKKIYDFYLKSSKYINNWDLVDLSAYKIVGSYLFDKPRTILLKLAKSKSLWERRISIISTFYFIAKKDFNTTFSIAEILIYDKEDLIQKAVGWMLREIGKRDLVAEENFLKKHYKIMGRTMLRYAIEKFPEAKRQNYLKGVI